MINYATIISSLPALMRGAWLSIQIASFGCLIGLTLGIVFGVLHGSTNRIVRSLVMLYTTIIRGTPMLIQILFIAYVLPNLGIALPLFWSAVVAIGLNSSAYIGVIIHSGITSVPRGQVEAARVLGFTSLQISRYIVLPQAIRVVFPALGNEFITLIKDSSLASVIGVEELTNQGQFILSRTYDAITIFGLIALCYLTMTTLLSYVMILIERRMQIDA